MHCDPETSECVHQSRSHLEDVGDVSEVEDVVKANGSGQKVLAHFLMKTDGGLHQRADHTTHTVTVTALLEVTAQNTAVYSAQSIRAGEMNCKH